GSAAHEARAPLALELLRDDAEEAPFDGLGPGAPLRSEREHAHLERLLVEPGRPGDRLDRGRRGPGTVRVTPVTVLHQRGAGAAEEAGEADGVPTCHHQIAQLEQRAAGLP